MEENMCDLGFGNEYIYIHWPTIRNIKRQTNKLGFSK